MYIATYKVLDPIYGNFNKDTIIFMVFDHHGKPWLSGFEYALIPVSEYVEGIVHAKYLFFNVYPTSAGGWATCGSSVREIDYYKDTERLEEIEFSPILTFPFLTYEGADPSIDFPDPVYEHEEGFAVCKPGVDVSDLFQHLKNGVLSTRGFFEQNR